MQIATVIKAGVDGALTATEAGVDQGLFMDLDRNTINQLIKTLRKARDQAYGQDA